MTIIDGVRYYNGVPEDLTLCKAEVRPGPWDYNKTRQCHKKRHIAGYCRQHFKAHNEH